MVKVIARKAFDITKVDFADFFDGKHAKASPTRISFDYPKTKQIDIFQGSFQQGNPVNGHADVWKHKNYKTGELYFAFSDMTLSAPEVFKAAGTTRVGDDKAIIQKLLSGGDNITGSKYDDKLYGYAGDDTIVGGKGLDKMDGGVGAHDRADYGASYKAIQVTLSGASFATVNIGGVAEDLIRNIEDVAGGHSVDQLVGDAVGNGLFGNDGDDTLVGLGGSDKLLGGKGIDILVGGAAGDSLKGGADGDILSGGAGTDTLTGDAGDDTLAGGAKSDTLLGGKGNDTLFGGAGGDSMDGGKGLDIIEGDVGRDIMAGGADADIFRFVAITDSTSSATGRDFITDFVHRLDKIDLSAIDAMSSATPGVDEAFVLDKHKGTATSAVAEGHIGWYVVDAAGTANDRTFIRVNYNADATIEMTIELQGAMKLTNVDFIL